MAEDDLRSIDSRSTVVSVMSAPKSAVSRNLITLQGDETGFPKLDIPQTPETEAMNVLKPIIWTLKLLGTWPKEGIACTLRMNFWNYVVLAYLHIYTIHMTLNWFSVVKHTHRVFAAFEQVTGILRTAICALSVDIRFKRHDHTITCLQDIGMFPTLNHEFHLKVFKKQVVLLTVGSWMFISFNIGLGIYTLIYKDPRVYVNWLLYGDFSEVVNLEFVRMVMIIDWGIYLILVVTNECFSKCFFVAFCLMMHQKIRDYNVFMHRIQERGLVKGTSQVQELYQLHTKLTSLVTELDDHYCFPVLMWYITLLVNLCVKIESIVDGIQGSNFSQFIYLLTDITYYTIAFIAITLTAATVGEPDRLPIMSVLKMAEAGDARDWHFQHETQMLLAKLNTPMMKMTGWGCFVISKSFMLTVLGSLATYTIIVIQMHMEGDM